MRITLDGAARTVTERRHLIEVRKDSFNV